MRQKLGMPDLAQAPDRHPSGLCVVLVEAGFYRRQHGIEFGLRELDGESFCGWQKTPIEPVTAENVVVE